MSGVLAAGGAVAALFASTFSSQVATPPYFDEVPTDEMVIEVATVNGSGCPAGTAAVAVSPDNKAFTVTYSDYVAVVGPQAGPMDFRKNCQVNLVVHVPQGFTYAIASVDYRGYGYLAEGASALQKASYYFQGSPDTDEKTHNYTGPMDDNWSATDITEIGALVWAPCGELRNFNINTELRVNRGTSDAADTSFMAMDSTDGDVNTTYQLAWKECPADDGGGGGDDGGGGGGIWTSELQQ